MASPNPSKRRRTDEETEAVPSDEYKVQKSPDVWMEDGNVVLQAENIQFKVHWSVLSALSCAQGYV